MKRKFAFLKWKTLRYAAVSLCLLAAATGLGWIFGKAGFPDTNIVLLYILAVLVTSRLTEGYAAGLLTSVAATLAFNYFFTDPYFTLNVNDPSYLITFAIMTGAAVVTSALTSKAKKSEKNALERERETKALYQFTSRLTEASDMSEIARAAVEAAGNRLDCRAAFLCFNENGRSEPNFIQVKEDGTIVRRKQGDEELEHRMQALRKAYDENSEFFDYPVYSKRQILGVVRIPRERAAHLTDGDSRYLHSLLECTALALGREYSVKQQVRSHQETIQERYRSNLLRAISHDLRTPLSGIMGTSEMIMDMSEKKDPRHELAKGICKDAHWLHALVENILSLTKLQEGRLILAREPEAAEEIIGEAIRRMSARAPEYEISVKVPDEVLMVPMDGKLIMQVLINLLDNAVKHSAPDQEIRISVRKDTARNEAVFTVADRGEGIAAKDIPNIFQTFYTSQIKSADAKKGIGLGLPICEAIIKAHGGSISGRNRTDGPGAEFLFSLPLTVKKEDEKIEPVS